MWAVWMLVEPTLFFMDEKWESTRMYLRRVGDASSKQKLIAFKLRPF
jgi:hypothetical protein